MKRGLPITLCRAATAGLNRSIKPIWKIEPFRIGQGDQFVRLGKRHGDRLFQKDVHARLQKDRGDLVMGAGRHGDARRRQPFPASFR